MKMWPTCHPGSQIGRLSKLPPILYANINSELQKYNLDSQCVSISQATASKKPLQKQVQTQPLPGSRSHVDESDESGSRRDLRLLMANHEFC
jgi:hypothetical protein